MKNTNIKEFIHSYRIILIKHQFIKECIQLIIGMMIFFLLASLLESIYYFSQLVRTSLINHYIFFLSSFFVFFLIKIFLHVKSIFNNSNDEFLAKHYKMRNPQIGEDLLNALQLENSLNNINKGQDLAKHAIEKINSKLKNIPADKIKEDIPRKLKKTFVFLLITMIIIGLFTNNTLPNAFSRLIHPSKNFLKPLPFTLKSLSKNKQILGGDSLRISIAGYGKLPKSMKIHWKNKHESGYVISKLINETYDHDFLNIKKNTIYWAQHESKSWFSPWKEITTPPDTIFVIDRPVINEISFTITPPEYTNENDIMHPGNITNIAIPEGSNLRVSGASSKAIQSASLILDDIKHELLIQNKNFNGLFQIKNNHQAKIIIIDENNVSNLHPPNYQLNILKDLAPEIFVINPSNEFELNESNIIGFEIQINDDYGFSNAWIEYNIKTPEYLKQDTITYKRNILELQNDMKSQQIYHEWNVDNLNLAPEDELQIIIKIADNNNLSGPLISSSGILIGKYPSMEDLFNRIQDSEEEIKDYGENLQMTVEDVQELVEEIELELLKSENINWEQEQKVEETLEMMDDIFSQIEDIQETMKKIEEEAQKNNLMSDQLIEKFSQFQELLDTMMTPEILEAMEKMQNAMEEMDPQKLLDALNDFEFDIDGFEEQLDRFIDMFELALAEQKMDEVIKKLENILEEQTDIVSKLTNDKDKNFNSLSSRERRQEEEFKMLMETIKEASLSMEKLSPIAAQELSNLSENKLSNETLDDLNQARMNMQNKNLSNATQTAIEAKNGLNEMLESAKNIQANFQKDTLDAMLRKFLALIQNLLFISNAQEDLIIETQNLRSRSPKLIESAIKQDRILRENQQFMIQLTELSKTTFHISPAIASSIGKTKAAMDKAIAKLEQKQTSIAKNEMQKALNGLNHTGKLLLESTNQMQMSGSGSGIEQFMEQMEKMSEAQKGINQSTSLLPQLSMMAQQQMMQKLQQQQQQLKNQLEELLKENPNQESGGLSKVNNDMEEVINDFRKQQINRRTQERQQRILSRMLDSQKSLSQKDFSEKRKSQTGEEIIFTGPMGLPENKGERELLLINAMNSALKEGHSKEYQSMMKKYFRNIQKRSTKDNE